MATDARQGTWKVRRRIIHATLVFCALQVGYLTFKGEDTRLNETLAMSAYALAGAVIGSYVFGAVFEDTRIRPRRRETYGEDDSGGSYNYGA